MKLRPRNLNILISKGTQLADHLREVFFYAAEHLDGKFKWGEFFTSNSKNITKQGIWHQSYPVKISIRNINELS